MYLWRKHAFSKDLNIEACIIKGDLGVLFQLLGQVGAGRGGEHVGSVATVLRDLQLLHETHGPAGRRERGDRAVRGEENRRERGKVRCGQSRQ